ncbi:MAG: endonuclease domain-containing protein [Sphingomicrobium sp.]
MSATGKTYKSARRLRKQMSLPEVLLWRLLRKASPPIRRQHPLGAYVIDFYCPAAKLAIEVDGFAHDTGNRPERDNARERWLERQGLTVLRIPAGDVLRDPESCAEGILILCKTPPPQR